MTVAPTLPRAFAVWFKDLRRWSVSSYFKVQWKWPADIIKPLETALERRIIPVDRSKVRFSELGLVTLHFDGELERRDLRGKETFKGKLFTAQAGDVIYSKIDVRNGAIGIVPPQMPQVAASSEYPVYHVRPEIALPEYVKLLFRTAAFRQEINSMISGASGRKRVQPSDLERIEVPLPPLTEQGAIVERWRNVQGEIRKSRQRLETLNRGIDARFLRDLGLTPQEELAQTKCFAVQWKEFHRWSVSHNRAARSGMSLSSGKYNLVGLGSVLNWE